MLTCKTFSATKARDRAALGERVTEWLRTEGAGLEVVDKRVLQSSDCEFHCLSVVLWLAGRGDMTDAAKCVVEHWYSGGDDD